LRTAGRKTTAAHRGPSTDSGTSSGTPLVVATTNAERLLIAIAAEVGLGRAISVLEGERARVRALING
jgi:UDP:flavonoid glycosyltransferase YjiC (YdhE family)